MKKLFFVALLFALGFSGIAQVKKDNTITIVTGRTSAENYKEFGKYLVQQGYTFENKDSEFGTLETDMRRDEKNNKYKLFISCMDKKIIVRPKLQLMNLGGGINWENWHYAKSKSNYFNQAWRTFAPELAGFGEVFYTRE